MNANRLQKAGLKRLIDRAPPESLEARSPELDFFKVTVSAPNYPTLLLLARDGDRVRFSYSDDSQQEGIESECALDEIDLDRVRVERHWNYVVTYFDSFREAVFDSIIPWTKIQQFRQGRYDRSLHTIDDLTALLSRIVEKWRAKSGFGELLVGQLLVEIHGPKVNVSERYSELRMDLELNLRALAHNGDITTNPPSGSITSIQLAAKGLVTLSEHQIAQQRHRDLMRISRWQACAAFLLFVATVALVIYTAKLAA